MSLVVRYPGRVCLLGEHCDWAGGASLTLPLPMGVEVTVEPAREGITLRSALHGELLEGRWPIDAPAGLGQGPLRFVPAALAALRARGILPPPSLLWVHSDLPAGRGFSSSAAFNLAITDALARAAGSALEATDLADLAYEIERSQGVACGRLDPLACAAASPTFFRWTGGEIALRPVRPPGPLHLVIGAFPAPRDTALILRTLAEHVGDDLCAGGSSPAAQAAQLAITTFGQEAERGALAIELGQYAQLGESMNRCQAAYQHAAAHLPALRAPRLMATTALLWERGAWGAKFSGAGGDGSVIALFPDALGASEAALALEADGLAAWAITAGAP